MSIFIKRLSALLCLLISWIAYAQPAGAQSLSIKEIQPITFPTMALGSGRQTTLTINPLNSSTSGNAQIVSGNALRGQYALSITGTGSPVTISIDITGTGTIANGLTLDNFHGYYANQKIDSFPSSGLPLPATAPSSTTLYLGATITAQPSLQEGKYNATLGLSVFIQ